MGKKSKKTKKHKSHKDKKHKKKYSESSSSSDSDTSGEVEWVEKKIEKKEEKSSSKRDDWMLDTSFVPTYSIHDKKRPPKEEKNESIIGKLGQSDRELNPYWKDGGTGLPEEPAKRQVSNYDDYYRSGTSKGFMKPEDDDRRNYTVYDKPTSSKSRWRKQPAQSSAERSESSREERSKPFRDVIDKKPEPPKAEKSSQLLSNEEMNALASKRLKAEIMGNQALVKELSEKLEKARTARQAQEESSDVVVLTNVNSRGFAQPVRNISKDSKSDKRKKNYETHADGKRVRYFEDDEKYTLNEMFEKEQMKSTADHNMEFMQLASKSKGEKDYAIDDLFMEQTISNKSKKDKDMQQAIDKQKKTEKALDECLWCLTNNKLKKHLVVSTGSKCYLCVPYFQSLTEGHCLIVPTYHATCTTLLDEDVWQEIMDYCKLLVQKFRAQDQDVVFFETATHFKYYPHMVLHCVPIPYESGNLAPIYFKKAIQECEKEWAINKKLVEYKKMDVRRAVPKGLPYFMVNFGMDCGFAHVIEEEQYFPKNFAQEIIGGILDLDHRIWRKQNADDFETQCKKVNKFKEMWKDVEPST